MAHPLFEVLEKEKTRIKELLVKNHAGEVKLLLSDKEWLENMYDRLDNKIVFLANYLKTNLQGDCTLQEIASALGVTKERVRQLETQAIKKIRHPKCAKTLREYLDK